jgi:2-methylcitrate dehydratase PrpD
MVVPVAVASAVGVRMRLSALLSAAMVVAQEVRLRVVLVLEVRQVQVVQVLLAVPHTRVD